MAEHNYMSFNEVCLIVSEPQAVRYLRFLRDRDFTEIIELPLNRRLHCLSSLGWAALQNKNLLRVGKRFLPSSLRTSYISHTLETIQARLAIEKDKEVSDFLPEKTARHYFWQKYGEVFRGKSCDAEIFIQLKRKYKVGFEVQLSKKSGETYESYVRKLEQRTDLDRVLWACKNELIKKGLQQAVLNTGTLQGHIFSLLNDIKESGLKKTSWYDKNNKKVEIFK